jgi:outer membrane lipoprotein-sorting protein
MKPSIKGVLGLFILWWIPLLLSAQEQKPPLTNTDIISMTKSGIGEQVIILAIQKSKTNFDTSPEALIHLKSAGVSDNVLNAILNATPIKTVPDEQDCSQMLDKVLLTLGPPETICAIYSLKLVGTSVVAKPSGTSTFHIERIALLPDSIYVSLQPTTGVGGRAVVTPAFNYLTSGKMTTALPPTTLNELETGLKLDLMYIAQHRGEYACVLKGTEKIGNIQTVHLEIKSEEAEGHLYADPDTGRLLRVAYQTSPTSEMISDLSDWRLVDGVSVPFKRHVVGNGSTTDVTLTEFQVNPQIDPALFQPPPGQIASSITLRVLQSESVPYTVETNGGISTACNIGGSTSTTTTASTYGNTTYGTALSTPNLQMNCRSTDNTIRWKHILNAMFVEASDGNAYIIACDRAWAWSKCTPLRAGDTFWAKRSDKGFVVQSITAKSKEQEATYSILQSKSLH